jgi:imidazolonepropionase
MQLPDQADILLFNCKVAAMTGARLSAIDKGAVAISRNLISWVGPQEDLPENIKKSCTHKIDCKKRWILPGFVDCHTHLIWAGSRTDEFEQRISGTSYEKISKQGGGIFSTVKATRKAGEDELFNLASKRIKTMLNQGTTTIEIKSGYGLNLETELKMLKTADRLDKNFPVHIQASFLGAHALPPEFKNRSDSYIDFLINTVLPAVREQSIASAVDGFCEKIAFSPEQMKKIFHAAEKSGFRVKLHAEQLSDSGGAAMAAQFDALSCDHLEYLSVQGAEKMAEHDTIAVLLPGAFYYLKETQKPPVDILRKLGVKTAVATDLNPGSSPVFSMPLILNMACVLFGLTCEEALAGATINAAHALGLEKFKGSIEPGKHADLVAWDIDHVYDLCCFTGSAPADLIITQGSIYKNSLEP